MRLGLRPVALAFLAAGCLSSPGPYGASDPGVDPPAECPAPPDLAPGLPCPVFLVATDGKNLEPSLATHPRDPSTLLVTWTERNSTRGSAHAWAALTQDGGATWVQTALHDPALAPLVEGAELYSFDSTAAFGPDGTAYVLYGGETDAIPLPTRLPAPVGGSLATTDRFTLAATKDGSDWEYHPFSIQGSASPFYAYSGDYMSMAVAPDSGRIYVVTDMVLASAVAELWFWSSDDGGRTWSQQPLGAPRSELAFGQKPRVGAGPNNQVDVAVTEIDMAERVAGLNGDFEYWMYTSHDGGETFARAQLPTGATHGRGTPILTSSGHALGMFTADAVGVAESTDGLSWSFRPLAKADGMSIAWVMDAAASDGRVAVMDELLACGRPASAIARDGAMATSWEMRLIVSGEGGAVERTLTGVSGTPPVATNCGISNDYAGLAYASDGALWGAWSDSRGSAMPRIAVARLA